jgi:hypothetical protein
MLNGIQMKRPLTIAWIFLGLLIATGSLLLIFYDQLPWVGTHFVYEESTQPTRWSVNLKLQQGRVLGGEKATLEDVPAPSNQASLTATLLQQGQLSGQEWAQALRIESVESVQYSWDQKGNKDILRSTWDARVGKMGGLRSLQVPPDGRSIWLRNEVITPWLLTLWPQFLARGVEPKQSWTALVPFRITARELTTPFSARWDCTWTFRGTPPDARVPLATLDLQAQAHSDEQLVDGNLRAEVVYSMLDRKVVAGRGSFQVRLAATTQATEQSVVSLMECVQGQFLLQRLIPGQDSNQPNER